MRWWRRAQATAGRHNGSTGPKFVPVQVAVDGPQLDDAAARAFGQGPQEGALCLRRDPGRHPGAGAQSQILYYSDHPSYLSCRSGCASTTGLWCSSAFSGAGVDPALVARLTAPVRVDQLGLVARDASGRTAAAKQVDRARAQGVPFVFLVLMFITIMSSAPQLLNSVIEEKMSRDQRGADRLGHAVRVDDGQTARRRRVCVAAGDDLRARRSGCRELLGLRRRRRPVAARLVRVLPRDGRHCSSARCSSPSARPAPI